MSYEERLRGFRVAAEDSTLGYNEAVLAAALRLTSYTGNNVNHALKAFCDYRSGVTTSNLNDSMRALAVANGKEKFEDLGYDEIFFQPKDIYTNYALYQSSVLSTITKDGSNNVTRWDSSGTLDIPYTQGTSGVEPLYVADDGNSNTVLRYSNDCLVNTGDLSATSISVCAVVKDTNTFPVSAGTFNRIFTHEESGGANRGQLLSVAGDTDTTQPIWREFTYGTETMYIDDVAVSNNTPFSTNTWVTLGASIASVSASKVDSSIGGAVASSSSRLKGDMWAILIAEHETSATNMALLGHYLRIGLNV